MKPRARPIKHRDARVSAALPLCVRGCEMIGRLARSRASRGIEQAFLFILLMALPLLLPVTASAQLPTERVPVLSGYNSWHIAGGIAAFIIGALLIVWVLIIKRRRGRAEIERERFADLAEAEHRHLDEIVSNVPGIVWETLIDPDTNTRRTTFISDYVEKMLGYTPDEWLSSTPGLGYRIMLEEDRERAARASETVIKTGKDAIAQFRWEAKDGRLLWVESHLSPIVDGDGKIVGLRGVSIDITEKKMAEGALRDAMAHSERTRAQLESVFQTVSDGIVVSDMEGKFLLVNEAEARITEYASAEEMKQKFSYFVETCELYYPDGRLVPTGEWPLSKVLRGESITDWNLRARRRDTGREWFFSFSGEPVRDERGQQVLAVLVTRDITERKLAEESLHRAMEEVNRLKNQLQEENIYLQEEIKLEHNFSEIVGHSDAIKYILHKIEQVAPTDSTVLIMGETGTGKELVARAIHATSLRGSRPLVKVNCAALSPTLIESELFGHEKGAFTGALSRKIGRFELANGATIFLDEIGELPPELQVKLLRVIQEGEFERLGSSRTIRADVRIIAATNRNLGEEVQQGRFREDLWYRLHVFPITMPPLRQRMEDIPLLVEHFVNRFSKKMGKNITLIAPATMNALRNYSWPGNVRELANVIERAVINNRGPVLHIQNISEALQAEVPFTPNKTLEEMEREYIITALGCTGWRIEGPHGAAMMLGLHPSTLRTRMAKLNIQKPQHNSA